MAWWDRWAPAIYLLVIGLCIGFVTGYAIGAVNGASGASVVLLLPVAAIIVTFIVLTLVARKVGPRA